MMLVDEIIQRRKTIAWLTLLSSRVRLRYNTERIIRNDISRSRTDNSSIIKRKEMNYLTNKYSNIIPTIHIYLIIRFRRWWSFKYHRVKLAPTIKKTQASLYLRKIQTFSDRFYGRNIPDIFDCVIQIVLIMAIKLIDKENKNVN